MYNIGISLYKFNKIYCGSMLCNLKTNFVKFQILNRGRFKSINDVKTSYAKLLKIAQ